MIELRGDLICFTHPLLASSLFSDASPRARRAVHGRLAAVVADPEESARHLALAAEGPDAGTASRLAEAAARARSRGAVAAGAELAEQAFHLTPPELAADAHGRLLVAAEQHYAAGNTTRAVELLDGALAADAAGPCAGRAALEHRQDHVRGPGRTRSASTSSAARSRSAGGDDRLRAQILVEPRVPGRRSRRASATPRSTSARRRRSRSELGDELTLARALVTLAHLKYLCGDALDDGSLRAGVAVEEQLGGLDLDHGPTVMYATRSPRSGRVRAAHGRCSSGSASAAARPGTRRSTCRCGCWPGWSSQTGNWDRAAALAIESHDVAVQTGREAAEPRGMFTLARVEARAARSSRPERGPSRRWS